MANNQIAPTFLNFANNVSLSQNKWNDSRLHQNKGCYYNNLLSPFWKKKESFIGLPFQDGNDVYTLTDGTLYKNGSIVLQNIPDGYTYDILSNEVVAAFSNYDGIENYRFYKTLDNKLLLDFNDSVTDLNINLSNIAAQKVIQIPTKTGYHASFGLLTISKGTPFTYKFYIINFNSLSNIVITSSREESSLFRSFSQYVIVGGLVMNGTWAGFSVFPERGWQIHTRVPSGILINLENLDIVRITPDNLTVENVTAESKYNDKVYVHSGEYVHHGYEPGTTQPTDFYWDYTYLYFYDVVKNPKTYFYFSKLSETGFTINDTQFPSYGFEMWVSNINQLYDSSLQIKNTIEQIIINVNTVKVSISSDKIILPYSEYNKWTAGIRPTRIVPKIAVEINYNLFNITNDVKNAYQNATFGFSSSSFITEDFQENVYCGCYKAEAITEYSTAGNNYRNAFSYYFSLGYSNGNFCEDLNVNSPVTFENLKPGDLVTDPSPNLWKSPYNFYMALGNEGSVRNILTQKGNALMQWGNTNALVFGEKDVVYGKFIDSNTWFKIKKCAPYIINKFNNYMLINCDGLNAYNLVTGVIEKCWSIGYNGSLFREFTNIVSAHAIELSTMSVADMPDIIVAAGCVNNHMEVTEDYFSGSLYNFITAYNFNDYEIQITFSDYQYNPFVYEIELYTGTGTDPVYVSTKRAESSQTYTNTDLIDLSYVFSSNLYSYFLCNFSYEFYFNRFGVISLGDNIFTNVRVLQDVYQVNQYELESLLADVEHIFIVMGQIYMIKGGYIFNVILSTNFSITYQNPITECKNLIFCGNTSKFAFFYSPLTKAFYKFSGSQIFEYIQDASDVVDIITYKNNYYMNVSLISFLDAEGHNKVLMIQGDYSVICWEDTDDLDELSEGNISNIVIEKDHIYLVTTQQTVYAIMFYDNKENFTKLRLEYESETLLNDFSQNIIDCIYVNVMKKGLPYGKVWVSLVSGSGETKQEFNLKELMEDRNGLSLIRYQPKFQQRGRVAIRVESEVPVENIAYTVKTVGNEISHKRIEI